LLPAERFSRASALRDGLVQISAGISSCVSGHGEGFCAIHDVAVAIRKLQADGLVKKAAVVDGRSYGNGTAAIFRNGSNGLHNFDHQENIIQRTSASSIDLHMADRADDDEYLGVLIRRCSTRSRIPSDIFFTLVG